MNAIQSKIAKHAGPQVDVRRVKAKELWPVGIAKVTVRVTIVEVRGKRPVARVAARGPAGLAEEAAQGNARLAEFAMGLVNATGATARDIGFLMRVVDLIQKDVTIAGGLDIVAVVTDQV